LGFWNDGDGASTGVDIKNPNVSCTNSYQRGKHIQRKSYVFYL